MALSDDKQWAAKYLLDPLTAPEPSDETGPGTSFASRQEYTPSIESRNQRSTMKSPSAKAESSASRSTGLPTPPRSASPRSEGHFEKPMMPSQQSSKIGSPAGSPDYGTENKGRGPSNSTETTPRRRRVSSLSSRFPGDQSHRPLEMLRHEKKVADRSPHLRKMYVPGMDPIDRLDIAPIGPSYHHDGPFDAALRARNLSKKYSPLDAVRDSNAEALRATPPGRVKDSLERHRPLDGVASILPGDEDLFSGKRMEYTEGTDLMIEEGQYKRWPGIQYSPGDIKGKGEPSYSLEKALKDSKSHRRAVSDGHAVFEMTASPRPRSSSVFEDRTEKDGTRMRYSEWEQDIRRSKSGAGHGLYKRFSLRQKQNPLK